MENIHQLPPNIPPGSYLLDYWAAADEYFPSTGIEHFYTFENTVNDVNTGIVTTEEEDAANGVMTTNDDLYEYRDDLANLADRLKGLSQASPWIAEPNSISSYRNVMEGLRDYLKENGSSRIGNAPISDDDGWPTTKEFFYYTLQQYVDQRGGPGSVYSQDVAFDQNGIVEAIRIKSDYVRLIKPDARESGKSIDDAERQIDAMEDTRMMIDDWTDLPPRRFVYCSKYFRIEGYQVLRKELIVNITLAVIAVSAVVFLTLPSPMTAFLITLNVAFCLIEILGFMWAIGIVIDTISVVNLILAVGLSVDYSAHVGHSFMMKGGYSKKNRVTEALADMGSAVLAGGISTFLAVSVLLFLKSYVFYVLSRQLCLTVILGLAHGLVLLPIMLSLVGPRPFGAATSPVYEEEIIATEYNINSRNGSEETSIMDRGISSSFGGKVSGGAASVDSLSSDDSSTSSDDDSDSDNQPLEKMFTDEDNDSDSKKKSMFMKSKSKIMKSKTDSSRGLNEEGNVRDSFLMSKKKNEAFLKNKKSSKRETFNDEIISDDDSSDDSSSDDSSNDSNDGSVDGSVDESRLQRMYRQGSITKAEMECLEKADRNFTAMEVPPPPKNDDKEEDVDSSDDDSYGHKQGTSARSKRMDMSNTKNNNKDGSKTISISSSPSPPRSKPRSAGNERGNSMSHSISSTMLDIDDEPINSEAAPVPVPVPVPVPILSRTEEDVNPFSPPELMRNNSLSTALTVPPTSEHGRENIYSSFARSMSVGGGRSVASRGSKGKRRSAPWYMGTEKYAVSEDDSSCASSNPSTASSKDCDESVIDSLCEEWSARSVKDPHFWMQEDQDDDLKNEGTHKTNPLSDSASSSSEEEEQFPDYERVRL